MLKTAIPSMHCTRYTWVQTGDNLWGQYHVRYRHIGIQEKDISVKIRDWT